MNKFLNILVLGVLFFGFIGCGDDKKSNQNNIIQNDLDKFISVLEQLANKKISHKAILKQKLNAQNEEWIYEYDKDSKMEKSIMKGVSNGLDAQMIHDYGADKMYANSGGSWVEIDSKASNELEDFDQAYALNEIFTSLIDEINTNRSHLKYQGTSPCGAFTCHVYKWSANGATSTISFDTAKYYPRHSDTTTTTPTPTNVSVDFEYQGINIKVPKGATNMQNAIIEQMQKEREAMAKEYKKQGIPMKYLDDVDNSIKDMQNAFGN